MNKEELKKAGEIGKRIAAWLENEIGLAKGIRACSGNGYHWLLLSNGCRAERGVGQV